MRDFTPVFDVLIKKYDIYTALVYGRIWRYCQGEKQKCFKSQTKIAEQLGIGRTKVNTAISTLTGDGFLTSTPIGGSRKSYKLTNKIDCSRDEQFTKATDAVHETNSDCSQDEQPPIKRGIKKDSKRGNDSPKKRKRSYSTPPSVELARRISHIYPPKKLHDSIDRRIGSDFGSLLKWGRIVRKWIASGWSPTNYDGMINVFRHGWNNRHGKDEKNLTPGVAMIMKRAQQRAEAER